MGRASSPFLLAVVADDPLCLVVPGVKAVAYVSMSRRMRMHCVGGISAEKLQVLLLLLLLLPLPPLGP